MQRPKSLEPALNPEWVQKRLNAVKGLAKEHRVSMAAIFAISGGNATTWHRWNNKQSSVDINRLHEIEATLLKLIKKKGKRDDGKRI